MATEAERAIVRLAEAAERIADALEAKDGPFFRRGSVPQGVISVPVHLDTSAVAKSVLNWTIKQAARGPSSLAGGPLSSESEEKDVRS